MAIHEGTIVVGASPRIGRATFAAVLRNHPGPAADEAEAGWEAVRAEGVDPLFALAVVHQESQHGTDGVCFEFNSRSPGNTRSSRTGDMFQALYWVDGEAVDGQRRWWISDSGSRIWGGSTVQQPGETGQARGDRHG